jgi:choline dehydrogenase-like flavoprotein
MGLYANVDGFEDQYYQGRKPIGFSIPRFRNITERRPDYLRGFNLQGEASRSGWWRAFSQKTIGADLKNSVSQPGPWSIGFTGFGECLPYSENRITLNTDQKDKFGRNTISVDTSFRENEKAMHKDMAQTAGEIMEAAGFKNIHVNAVMSFPGNANHEMGTARMGRDPKTSVLNSFNQMHEVPNVFITDGSFMTSSSNVNPSLTYMAMTARACDYAVREMKKQNI